MVPRPLQKSYGDSHFHCVHNPHKKISSLKSSFLLNHIVALSNSLYVLQFFYNPLSVLQDSTSCYAFYIKLSNEH